MVRSVERKDANNDCMQTLKPWIGLPRYVGVKNKKCLSLDFSGASLNSSVQKQEENKYLSFVMPRCSKPPVPGLAPGVHTILALLQL